LGNGGDISLQADQISVENAQIVATTQLQGNGGTIRLNSPGNITLSNGASLNAGTFGSGVGGNISVNVPSDLPSGATLTTPGVRPTGQNVTLSGGSTINAGTSGTGLGGNVQVGAGGILRVDNSTVTVSSTGSPINGTPPGNAGTLRTNSRYVQLDNGQLAATSFASNGGNIDMTVDNILLLRNRGLISTQSDGPESRDGNIAIRAGGIVAIPQENSDIIARSSRQGNVEIETQAIIGIAINQGMDEIPTISEVLSTGDTVLNLGIDPSQGTQELDQEPRDVELAQGCDASSGEDEAGYVDIGQGGQAAGPDDSLSSGTLATDWVDLESAGTPSNRPTLPAAQQAAQSAQPAPTCP
jgi:large exoprotein involved in heme utilization and adhesion